MINIAQLKNFKHHIPVVIDFKTNQLWVGEAVTPIHHSTMEVLPKQCAGCLSLLQLSFKEGKRNCCGLLFTTLGILVSTTLMCWSQKRAFEAQHQLLVGRVVALPDNELMLVRMANLTPVPITLYQRMRIGDFWPLSSPTEACTGETYQEIPESTGLAKILHIGQKSSGANQAKNGGCFLGVDTKDADASQLQELEALGNDFQDTFSTSRQDLGRTNMTNDTRDGAGISWAETGYLPGLPR